MPTATPRRSSRTRVERVPIINDSADDFSEFDSNTDVESDLSFEGASPKLKTYSRTPRKRARTSVTPVAKRSSSIRKKTPLRNGPRRSSNDESLVATPRLPNESGGNQIAFIEILLDFTKKKSEIQQSVQDWNQLYRDQNDIAIASIMSFLLHLCGCSQWFPADRINDDLNDPSFIKPFQSSIEESNSTDGLLSPNKAISKRVESRLKTWSTNWIAQMPPSTLLESDILPRIIEWAATLSQNSIRSIRLVSCTFIFSILCALIPCRQKLQNQLVLIEKSLQQKSKRPAKAVAQITEDKIEYQSNLDSIDQNISVIFQEIFVPRYRDIYSAVRERCIESLRDWILASDSFASDAYFKYLGWALNSSFATVRLLAIRAINDLVKADSVRSKMSSFLNRFVERIIEMHHDVDESVGSCAIDTCTTILVHDDVLTNFEAFGDVAPFLWDRSRLIREAAANYVFEDSFNSESLELPSNLSLQADIDQLFTIYIEAAPNVLSFPVIISTLVELFFFKLPCIRNREILLDRLKTSTDSRSTNANGSYSFSHFIAQMMLGCCNFAIQNKESHSRLSKNQRATVLAVFESYDKFISDSDYLSLLQQFQAEREVFCCLVELISSIAKNRKKVSPASTIEICSGVGTALLSFLNRETSCVHLATTAAALASLSNNDSQLERDIQQAVSECVDCIRTFPFSDLLSEESSLTALAALSRICSISQQIFCPILQESTFLDDILLELSRSITTTDNVEVASGIIESLAKISHSVILWGISRHLDTCTLQTKVSRLLDILQGFLSSGSERLSVLATCIIADISVVALNNPQIRESLSDHIFHLLRDFIVEHPTCLEIVKVGARLVCSFCPEHISICATMLTASASCDFDEHLQQIIKAAVGFLRLHDGHALASAILESLIILFKEKGLKETLSFSRRMAVSYGLSRTSASHFDAVVIGGIDKVLDADIDHSFLNALHPFINRSSSSMLKSIADHVQAVRPSVGDEAILPMLDNLYQFAMKNLPMSSTTSIRAHVNGDDGLKSVQSAEVGEQMLDAGQKSDNDSQYSRNAQQ